MRLSVIVTAVVMFGLLGLAEENSQNSCSVTIRLIDASGGQELPGLIRLTDAEGSPVPVKQLLSRGLGLEDDLSLSRWSVLPAKTTVSLPRAKLSLHAFSGLETETATVELDLTGKTNTTVSVPLVRFYDASAQSSRSANTHLHLQKISRADCDRYLTEVPQADGLDVLFLSYLERAVADKLYVSNRYTRTDLSDLTRQSGVLFGNGEEHRHNFAGFGQGYGHVMLLNIQRLIQPVSIGQGIMKEGTDGIPLQRGIDTARGDDATVIWCHNNWGLEEIANLVTGRLDAQNIFDGGTHGSYKDSFYRFLNAGIRIPFSTGTDWFMYDFSRVYARVEGELTIENWLDALSAGRNYITNGPILEFSVDGEQSGETVRLDEPGSVQAMGRVLGRVDFGRIELVRNGQVIAKATSKPVGGHFEAELTQSVPVKEACWLALRTPPPPVKGDPELSDVVAKNEFGRDLFSHTSAVYVDLAGESYFNPAVAQELLDEMNANQEFITQNANFADEQERARVLDAYRDGAAALQFRIEQATTQ